MTKLFGTDGIRGKVGGANINVAAMLRLGLAIGYYYAPLTSKAILLAMDTRGSGPLFEQAIKTGIQAAGVSTESLGILPSPALSFICQTTKAPLGIMISASHNSYADNGIKFFMASGCKMPKSVELELEGLLSQDLPMQKVWLLGKNLTNQINAQARYIQFACQSFSKYVRLSGLKVVLDCAHGANYHIAPLIFKELGAELITLHCEPNGNNINQDAGSLHPQSLRDLVLAKNADIGIAFDGDGDRVLLIDHQGEILDGDDILYILVKYYQQSNRLNGGVVGTVMSNYGLELALKKLKVPFVRTAVGDKQINQALVERDWVLGAESSGHVICRDLLETGDGLMSALRVLEFMQLENKSLHELKQGLEKLPQLTVNLPYQKALAPDILKHPDLKSLLARVEKTLHKQGRVLIRASGTEDLLRVMVEAPCIKLVKSILAELQETIQNVGALQGL